MDSRRALSCSMSLTSLSRIWRILSALAWAASAAFFSSSPLASSCCFFARKTRASSSFPAESVFFARSSMRLASASLSSTRRWQRFSSAITPAVSSLTHGAGVFASGRCLPPPIIWHVAPSASGIRPGSDEMSASVRSQFLHACEYESRPHAARQSLGLLSKEVALLI